MRYVMCRRKTVEKKMLKIWVSVLGMVQKQKDMSYPQLFFSEQGNGPEGPGASLTFSSGSTFYMKGSKKYQNYTQTLTTCTRDLKQEEEKAIRSYSYSTAARLDAADLKVAGDGTTWDKEAGARCINTRGPPIWHSSLEVVEDLQTSTGRSNCYRCTGGDALMLLDMTYFGRSNAKGYFQNCF
jgi:hypothetical protein